MNKRHVVNLAERERAALRQRVSAGRGRARELLHARILLKADQGPNGPVWTDGAIAAALEVSRSTVERVPKRFAEAGLEAALGIAGRAGSIGASSTASRRRASSRSPAARRRSGDASGRCGRWPTAWSNCAS